ncbi:MAG TPA: hypothetical protein VFV77_01635 [Gammaproteobacteria bacterium]|nr:hypothetical protein [Gammaproteobacteria bacterium]
MRPKKKIAVVDADADRAGILRFMLETNGYAAECFPGPKAAAPHLASFDCLVMHWEGKALNRRRAPHVPVIVLAPQEGFRTIIAEAMGGYDALIAKDVVASEFLERLKIITARKRGPRKGTRHFAPPQAVAV